MVSLSAPTLADEAPAVSALPDSLLFEASTRMRTGWTEIAFRSNRPKAWDMTLAPEFRTSLRFISGLFEAKAEVGYLAEDFAEHGANNTNTFRADVQVGLISGNWSALFEWKLRDTFDEGSHAFINEQDFYDLRVRKRFSLELITDLPKVLCQATAAAGYVAATPDFPQRNFAEFELEMVQRLSSGWTLVVAPKLELLDFKSFPGGNRDDAVFSLRVVPVYDLGGGMTVSVEGQATAARSSFENKTGESWSITPLLRFQKSL